MYLFKEQTTQCNIQVLLSGFLIDLDFLYSGISSIDPSFLSEDFPLGVNNKQKLVFVLGQWYQYIRAYSNKALFQHTSVEIWRFSECVNKLFIFLSGMFFGPFLIVLPPPSPPLPPFALLSQCDGCLENLAWRLTDGLWGLLAIEQYTV